MITIIVTVLVLVLVYKSFCNTVCIYRHANKASCCCCIQHISELSSAKRRPRSAGIIRLFFVVFWRSNCRLATFHSEVKNRRYRVFFDYKLTKLERGSQQTPYYKILFEAVFGNVFHTNARMLGGHEAFSFHFHKPFSLKFWVLGELESANFWFWVVFLRSSLWTWNQSSFKFSAISWAHQQWRHKFCDERSMIYCSLTAVLRSSVLIKGTIQPYSFCTCT